MSQHPIAFMSYVRFDDQHENGRLTQFCERLSGEVRMQTGDKFHIFQDRNDIGWGQGWKERIDNSLDAVTFLVPIITPGFFKSPACRDEFERFLQREKDLGRADLILPVYYVECSILSDETRREKDPIAKAIVARQWADWRDLRFEPFTSPEVGKTLAKMARQILEALERTPTKPRPEASTNEIPATAAVASQIESQAVQPREESTAAIGQASRGPSAKTEPPTRVVDALYRGDHATLTEALGAAKPGDRILIRPGLYKEGLVLDKPVEIVGDGEAGEVVIEASGKDVILFKASMGRIANVTLRQTGRGRWFGVDIAQGRLELEGCDITSQSLACVAIHGGADPRLRRNRIHGGKECGVLVFENGQGTLEDNDIFNNALAGVQSESGGNPTARRNRIHGGKEAGIYVVDDGQGTFEDNDIFGNVLSGVSIRSGGNPIVRRNRIYDGKQSGVYVYDEGRGTIEDNDIFGNKLSGVTVATRANPVVRRNRIHDGTESGVYAYHDGEGTFEDNDIFGNKLSGVSIHYRGNPTISRNRIHDGKEHGVYVSRNGQGTLEDNDIFGNTLAGIAIKTGGNPTVRRNRISKNGSHGVRVDEDGGGVIEDNDLRGNTAGAWDIAPDCESKVMRTRNQES